MLEKKKTTLVASHTIVSYRPLQNRDVWRLTTNHVVSSFENSLRVVLKGDWIRKKRNSVPSSPDQTTSASTAANIPTCPESALTDTDVSVVSVDRHLKKSFNEAKPCHPVSAELTNINFCWLMNIGVYIEKRRLWICSAQNSSYLMVCEMGGKWPYNCCFVRCCLRYLFKIARSILVNLPSSFSSKHFVKVQMVQPLSSTDTATTFNSSCFILFYQTPDFHLVVILSISVNALPMRMLMSLSVDEILLPRYINWSTNFI